MTITPAQIDIWRGLAAETQNLEFKEAGNQYCTRKLAVPLLRRHCQRRWRASGALIEALWLALMDE